MKLASYDLFEVVTTSTRAYKGLGERNQRMRSKGLGLDEGTKPDYVNNV